MEETESSRSSLLKFLPSGAKALIVLLVIFMLMDVPIYWSLQQTKLLSSDNIIPYILILLILIILILALYLVIHIFFKYSRNPMIKWLKHFTDVQVWGFFFFIVSLSYLYDLFLNFHNVGIYGPASYFISFTIWHIFLAIIGVLCFIFSKDKTFLNLLKGNIVYAMVKVSKNIVFKITTMLAYSLFLIYLIVFLFTIGIDSTTTGTVVSTYMESNKIISKTIKMRSVNHYYIIINDGERVKKFLLREEEWKKCSWEKVKLATIEHHIFWYSGLRGNNVIGCSEQ